MDKESIRKWWQYAVIGHSISTSSAQCDYSLGEVIQYLLGEADEKDRLVIVNESLRERIEALEMNLDNQGCFKPTGSTPK